MNNCTKISASMIVIFCVTGLVAASPVVDGALSPSNEYTGSIFGPVNVFGFMYNEYVAADGFYLLNDWCMVDELDETITGDDISWSGKDLDSTATYEFRLFTYSDSSTTPTDASFDPQIMLCRRPIDSTANFTQDILYDSSNPSSTPVYNAMGTLFQTAMGTCTHSESLYGTVNHFHWEFFMPKAFLGEPLVADAGHDRTLVTSGGSSVSVTLDGSGSTGDIVSWEWVDTYDDYSMGTTETVEDVILYSFLSPYTFRLTVTDSSGATSSDEVTIIVNEQ